MGYNIFEERTTIALVLAAAALVVAVGTTAIMFTDTPAETGVDYDERTEDTDTGDIQGTYGPGIDGFGMKKGMYDGIPVDAESLDEFEDVKTVDEIRRPADDVPEPIDREENERVEVYLEAEEVVAEIGDGQFFKFFTFNGTVPGPTIRAMEGDTVEVTLKNSENSTQAHNIDLHASTGPGGGAAVTNVAPGEEKTFEFEAKEDGTFIYHCAMHNIPSHHSLGQYGAVVVEPEGGLEPVDKEFTVFQGELYTEEPLGADGFLKHSPQKQIDEDPTYYTFNGKPAGLTGDFALETEVGDDVRIFFGNGGVSQISTFHLIGEIFDRGYYGGFDSPDGTNLEALKIGPGEVGTVEYTQDLPGDYTLVDHALARLDRGAWGVLEADGEHDPEIYDSHDMEPEDWLGEGY